METTANNPIFSTAYFPPIAYVAKAIANDTIVVESFETYPKQTYRNRAVIATANGELGLTVPVVKTNGNHTYTKDIEICYTENWALKHLRAIESAYNSSPYFLYYKDDVANILSKKQRTLLELNMDILAFVFKKLRVKTSVILSDDYTDSYSLDYRNTFSPKAKEELILPSYPQVFEDRFGFVPNLSILDLLFNMGPDSLGYLKEVAKILG